MTRGIRKRNLKTPKDEEDIHRAMFFEYREENAKDMQREANL